MAAPNGGNQIARRVIDDLIEFSGQTSVDGYMSFFKAQQIAEIRGFINRMHEEANTLRNLIGQLNALIAEMEALKDQAEEEIETKEAQIEAMNGIVFIMKYIVVNLSRIVIKTVCVIVGRLLPHPIGMWQYGNFDADVNLSRIVIKTVCIIVGRLLPHPIDKLTEDAESFWLQDKMKLWFMRAQIEEHSFSVVIRDFCFELRGTLSQNRRLIAELEALGQRGDTFKALEGLQEIVARDVVKLGVLEQLLAATRVGIPLKAGYYYE
ncbi:hypothetical protein Tco_0573349 [Tanacetum coccineum]